MHYEMLDHRLLRALDRRQRKEYVLWRIFCRSAAMPSEARLGVVEPRKYCFNHQVLFSQLNDQESLSQDRNELQDVLSKPIPLRT